MRGRAVASAYSANLRLAFTLKSRQSCSTARDPYFERPIACIPGEYIFRAQISREVQRDIANHTL